MTLDLPTIFESPFDNKPMAIGWKYYSSQQSNTWYETFVEFHFLAQCPFIKGGRP